MEAVRIRQRGAEDFAAYYESLCALQDTCPVASIRAGVKEGVLNCHTYRLKKADWYPLLTALQINRALHTVVFYNKWKERIYPNLRRIDGQKPVQVPPTRDAGSATHREMADRIARSVCDCMCVSGVLTSVVLEGLPLRLRDCKVLGKGLQKTSSLTHLSFKGSSIGDRAAEVLTTAVRNLHTLEWLDLTACSLTAQGAASTAALIKHQCLCRQSAAWKDSLRFRTPQMSQMPGLRRVTLNLNPDMGDRGAKELSEALRDDVCLKALDLQSCGITTEGASHFQEVLKLNATLIVLDLRANALLDDDVLDTVQEQLTINAAGMHGAEESYRWLEVEMECISRELRHLRAPLPRAHRTYRQQQQQHGVTRLPHKMKRSGGLVARRAKNVPWRTEARSAQRWKNLFSHKCAMTGTKKSRSLGSGMKLTFDDSCCESLSGSTSSLKDQREERHAEHGREAYGSAGSSGFVVMSAEKLKDLKVELSACHSKIKQEISAREKVEAQVLELELENRRLRTQLKHPQSEMGGTSTSTVTQHNSALNDEEALDAIESTFKQFNTFLDLMQEKGLGEICTLLSAAKLE